MLLEESVEEESVEDASLDDATDFEAEADFDDEEEEDSVLRLVRKPASPTSRVIRTIRVLPPQHQAFELVKFLRPCCRAGCQYEQK